MKDVHSEAGSSWQNNLNKDRPRELRDALRRPGGMFAVAKIVEPMVTDYYELQEDDFRDVDACKIRSWWNLVEGLAAGVFDSRERAQEFLRGFQKFGKKSIVKLNMASAVR